MALQPSDQAEKEFLHRQAAPRRRFWTRPAAAAVVAAVLVGLVGTDVVTGGEVVKRLLRLVPGAGFAETDAQSLVSAGPIRVTGNGHTLTVTGLVSNDRRTQVWLRLEGLTGEGVPYKDRTQSDRAVLFLPGGRQLVAHASKERSDKSVTTLEYEFDPLPPGIKSVDLHLSSIQGKPESVSATIPLTDTATARLPEVQTGGWSDEGKGVRITVPHMAFDGDRIGSGWKPRARARLSGWALHAVDRCSPTARGMNTPWCRPKAPWSPSRTARFLSRLRGQSGRGAPNSASK